MLKPPKGVRREGVKQSLCHIRHLSLDVSVTAEVFDELLKLMPNITSLRLECQFHMSSEEILSGLTNLNHMLVKLHIVVREDDRILKGLIDLYSSSLRELTLSGDGFNERDLERVFLNVPDLEYLDIWGCYGIETNRLRSINNLRRLRHFVSPTSLKIDEDIMTELATITTLRHLDLGFSVIDGAALRQIVHLTNLESLTIHNRRLTTECFAMICGNLEKLETLRIGQVHQLTDEAGKHLHRLKKLKHLRLSGASELTDFFFIESLGSPAMESLSIGGSSLTDTALISIGNNHPHLRELRIYGDQEFTDAGLVLFLSRETRLQTLHLGHCPRLTDRSLRALATLFPRLSWIEIRYARNITVKAIAELKKQRPALGVDIGTEVVL